MGELSFFNKIIYFINTLVAVLFLASFILPYLPPKTFPIAAVLSLVAPLFLVLHLIFVIYWTVLGFKKPIFISIFCLVLAFLFSSFPYKLNDKTVSSEGDLSIMTYNVRLFNIYKWIKTDDIPQKIADFVKKENPDILLLQEFNPNNQPKFDYPYKHVVLKGVKNGFGQAIYSKHRIVDYGDLNFDNSDNNAIYIDIVLKSDTIRIYNIHLESLRLGANQQLLTDGDSERLMKTMTKAFVKQQNQIEKFIALKANGPKRTVIAGDLNNTAYSWVYHQINSNMLDSFNEAGEKFGRTFDLKKYPLRIDFILVDEQFTVVQHKNYDVKFSDHYPVMARIQF
jgi:endonuclease/exonuclease/phosphatase family metal-dependent hydrolase